MGRSAATREVGPRATGMDVVRGGYSARRRRRWLWAGAGLAALAVVTWLVSLLEPAPPPVELETVYFGTVERGPMLRQVRGHGTLVPVEMRWIPARTRGPSYEPQPGSRKNSSVGDSETSTTRVRSLPSPFSR